jgi:DNA-directed RNA polymerase alpha subunit
MSEGQELPPIPADFEQFMPRTARALVRGGYRCLGDVQAASDFELLSLRNFGELSLAEVRAVGR